jgi:DNA-binding CsgD family transcriptional regulator
LGCRVAADLWDHDAWTELAGRGVRQAREAGALGVLPTAASYLAGVHMHAGEYAEAEVIMAEAASISQATGSPLLVPTIPMLAGQRGELEAVDLLRAVRQDAASRGQGTGLSILDGAITVLFNGLGRYDEACEAGKRAIAVEELSLHGPTLVEVVEAAARCGNTELAAATLERLAIRTRASGTDWAIGVEARSRALLADGPEAGALYEEAVTRLGRTRLSIHLARAQLVYGEWLRREKRRTEAREQLRSAHHAFTRIGAKAFAERARRELEATGETARKRTEETRDALTPQETQIASLAREGATNPEIGAQLFLSPRTVQYHLHKVFSKLGISSRTELRYALASSAGE